MALAEALKSNTTLKHLESAALPSNPLAMPLAQKTCTFITLSPSHPSFCRVRRLTGNRLGPEGGMVLAEALKSNTTLERLGSAALPPNPAPIPLAPKACTFAAHAPSHASFSRVRSLNGDYLGPEGGMALAEAVKSNTTLETLESAALQSNRPAHTFSPYSTHPRCTRPLSQFLLPCAQARLQQARPRGGHGARRGAQEQHHPEEARVCCPAIEPACPCL